MTARVTRGRRSLRTFASEITPTREALLTERVAAR